MDKIVVCKLEVTRKAGDKYVTLSCFIKILNDPQKPMFTHFLWERYRGDLMFVNFHSKGVATNYSPLMEFCYQVEGLPIIMPLFHLWNAPSNLHQLNPSMLYLGDGRISSSNEDLKWTIGLADPFNLPT